MSTMGRTTGPHNRIGKLFVLLPEKYFIIVISLYLLFITRTIIYDQCDKKLVKNADEVDGDLDLELFDKLIIQVRNESINNSIINKRKSIMPPKTGGKAVKKASKAQKSINKANKMRRRRKESYVIYYFIIYKVLNQVYPGTGISSNAMSIVNSFTNDVFERIAAEASRLAYYNKRSTITFRKIQTEVRLLLPGVLAKHAVSEGTPLRNTPA